MKQNLLLKFSITCFYLLSITIILNATPGNRLEAFSQLKATDAREDTIIRIMPLGNSITFGNNAELLIPEDIGLMKSYRQKLWQLLNEKGYPVDFVGSEVTGGSVVPAFDLDNAGFSGIDKGELLQLLRTGINPRNGGVKVSEGYYLDAYRPSVILLHIGTNLPTASVSEINDILDEIDDYEQRSGISTLVILAKIIKRISRFEFDGAPAKVIEYNAALETLAQQRIADGDNLVLVDMESGAGLVYTMEADGDMVDHLHPTESGFIKMANVWFSALCEAFGDDLVAPSNLTTSVVSQSSIKLNWNDNSVNELNFHLERATNSGGPFSVIATLNTNVKTYTDEGVSANQTYFYRVRASNHLFYSAYTNLAEVIIESESNLVSPSGLEAEVLSDSGIRLTWNDNSDNETDFLLERSTNSTGPFSVLVTLNADTESYIDEDVIPDQTYFYRIRATNQIIFSNYSNIVEVIIDSDNLVNSPSNLQAVALSAKEIQLTWVDNSDNEDEFILESSVSSNNNFVELATLPANSTTYIHDELGLGQTIFYRVKAVNENISSSYSNIVSTTTLITAIDEEKINNSINVFPNPSNDVIHISMENEIFGVYKIRILNLMGSELGNFQIDKKNNSFQHSIDLQHLNSGVYLLQITHNQFRTVKTVYVTRR